MKKICIVASIYYKDIIDMLIDGANEAIGNHKKRFKTNIIYVPGVFEIPHVISKNVKNFDAFIALGCVIKGETPHFDFISKSSIDALMKLSIESKKPIGNGILTCFNKDQAVERADKSNKNKGKEAADAAIELLIGDN
ncbi:6,7-dimethyl-8-ribityllumazine synthase [Candidatus Pelagibacter sp.]|nr:6,7-dimethyl-8-ribityllumazine synthase [Candidatus Pelagibacter sp.]